jgi:YVTN family beta-propeller protein
MRRSSAAPSTAPPAAARPAVAVDPTASRMAVSSSSATAGARAPALLYVCNQNDATVSVIDTRTNSVVRTVDLQKLGFTANAKPHHVQVEPDGSFW